MLRHGAAVVVTLLGVDAVERVVVARLLPALLQLRPLGLLDHTHDRAHVPPHRVQLERLGRRRVAAAVAEQVAGDLVLDEEREQLLGELDLLGERAVAELEQPLELRLSWSTSTPSAALVRG